MNMGMNSNAITSAIEEFGLTIEDVMVLMKGYEKFTESSMDEKKVMINKVKDLIEEEQ